MNLTRPYQWPLLGPWLKGRAKEHGRQMAYRLHHECGVEPEDILRYANDEVGYAAQAGCDEWMYESLGMALGARTIIAALHED